MKQRRFRFEKEINHVLMRKLISLSDQLRLYWTWVFALLYVFSIIVMAVHYIIFFFTISLGL